MDNTDKNSLTFPQRNWLLLCILVAIFSIGATYLFQRKNTPNTNGTEIKTDNSSAIPGRDSVGISPDSLRH